MAPHQHSSRHSSRGSGHSGSSGAHEDSDGNSSSTTTARSTILTLTFLLILCLFIMAFAGSLSVTMLNKQIEVSKLKILHETPDSPNEIGSDGNRNPNAAPVGVVDASPLLEDMPGETASHNVSYPSLKRVGAIDVIIREKAWGTNKVEALTHRYSTSAGRVWGQKKSLETPAVVEEFRSEFWASRRIAGPEQKLESSRRATDTPIGRSKKRKSDPHSTINHKKGTVEVQLEFKEAAAGEDVDEDSMVDNSKQSTKSKVQSGRRLESKKGAVPDDGGVGNSVKSHSVVEGGEEDKVKNDPPLDLVDPFPPHGVYRDATIDHCALEMLKTAIVRNASTQMCSGGVIGGKVRDNCKMDRPHRQGNLTKVDDLRQFASFPSVTDILPELEGLVLSSTSPASSAHAGSHEGDAIAEYWADYPTGLFPICANWREYSSQFTFHALYTLRRWFRVHKWTDVGGHAGKGDVLVVNERKIEFHEVNANVFSISPDPNAMPFRALRIDSIASITIAPSARLPDALWFLNISYDASADADFSTEEGRRRLSKVRLTSIFIESPRNAVLSLLKTLYILHRPLFGRAFGPLFTSSEAAGSFITVADEKRQRRSVQGEMSGTEKIGEEGGEEETEKKRQNVFFVDVLALRYSEGVAAENAFDGRDGRASLPVSPAQMHNAVRRWAPISQPAVLPRPWPYTTCHKFDQQQLEREATANNNMGEYKLFWPYRCDKLRETHVGCGQEERIESRRQGLRKVPISTAIVFAGFVRSFGVARFSLWENIVRPLQATPFASTWNVLGRTKKTETITRKMLVPVDRMRSDIANLMMLPPHANYSEHVQVFNYLDHVWMMSELRKHGFPHAGLYFLMSKAIQLVMAHDTKFDIIIRARFDIVALAPMRVVRVWKEGRIPTITAFKKNVQHSLEYGVSLSSLIESDVEYVFDFGASCELQGLWWPQYATVHTDKILKPPADTRYKFFGWQVCDWMEIGTAQTMAKLGGLFDWITDNYVFSAAQWVDHNFYISQGIAYLPTQLYLKIIRKRGKYFG